MNLKYHDQRNHILETADCTVSKEWVACFVGGLFCLAPDAVPSGELKRKLDPKGSGGTFADLGYPNGIPVKMIQTDGIGG